ncbi:MAG: amidase [Candidatus Nanopelagicales bacterium]|nr:amidase [Candidatus Nanopelagicales bacterium]
MAAPHDLTALEQARAIATREISAVELTEHYLARSAAHNIELGAFITLTPELALAQAWAADEVVARTSDRSALPVLHGVVVPVKDLNFVAGVHCTFGSKVFGITPPIDDYVVTRLRQGNTVMTGKTNTPEFGLSCYTENQVTNPARTPWDLSCSAGGSSGGAAAAVAAGLAPVAQGSDGGGSIRIPASVCGLVGLKTSRGRISNGPMRDGVGDLGVNGPLARTVADAAALLDVMSGHFVDDPFLAPPLGPGQTFLAAARRDPGKLRIGRYCTPVITDCGVDAQCLAAYEWATALLLELGHEVEDVPVPFSLDLTSAFETVWSSLALITPVAPEREPELMPLSQWLRERGRGVTGGELASAAWTLRNAARGAINLHSAYDVILTPALAQTPRQVGQLRNDSDPAADFEAQKQFTPFTAPYNMTGQPAINVPLYWTEQSLPIGVQLAGRPFDEVTLLSLAGQLERAHPWTHRHPVMW